MRTLHEVKLNYVKDTFALCGNSIELTFRASGIYPTTLYKLLSYVGIDHKIPVVTPSAVTIPKWAEIERKYILFAFEHFEYNQKKTRVAVGMSEFGFRNKLSNLGVPDCTDVRSITKSQLLAKARNFRSIHNWYDAEPTMVMAAHRLQYVETLKKELSW